MESIVLPEFRERYPTGCLICELLTIYDGSYVVRAIVELEGKSVATGFAAASTIEEAEDRARIRALEVLGVGDRTIESNPIPTAETRMRSMAEDSPPPVSPSLDTPSLSALASLNLESHRESQGEEGDFVQTTEPKSIEPEETFESMDDVERLMNKTTVEIRRLGWSAAQGRRYLEEKYEKRSRQHLTREELIEFLAYLESQPTP